MWEPEEKMEEPQAEEASLGKTSSKGPPVDQDRPMSLQQRPSPSPEPEEEMAAAASRPTTRERREAAATESVEEEQPEPGPSTQSSGRRLQQQSGETKLGRPSRSPAPAVVMTKVLFTELMDIECEKQMVVELGGSLAESVFDCTHLVTDRVYRTVEFLCALARGIPIVTRDWLKKSKQNTYFLSPNTFLVCDHEQESTFEFSLSESLWKAQREGGLFKGYQFHITRHVQPKPKLMRDIIKCSGGTFLPQMPRAYKDKRVVISCPEDLPRCRPAQDAGVPIANAEFILTGVLRQKIDLDAHRLDERAQSEPVPPTPP
ncbi:UNVERIFIED_CONTAM: hypothetical protein K2H54_070475 [Gekko kuhli]